MYRRTCGARDVIESGAVVTAATYDAYFLYTEPAHVNSLVLLLLNDDAMHFVGDNQ
jgi:hypothetical protein